MKKRVGFSLIELMLLVVTFAIVCAAMAPIYTKKVRSVNLGASPSKVSQNCTSRFNPYCTSCNLTQCLTCDRPCEQTKYVEISTCTCAACSKFTNCYQCSVDRCHKCKQGYYKKPETGKTINEINTCTICPKGYSCDGLNATKCPKGQYQPNTGKDKCIACPAGTYAKVEGTTDNCTACDAGYYCPKEEMDVPVRCPAGHYSAAGASACTACEAGKIPNAAQTDCSKCPAGTESKGAGGGIYTYDEVNKTSTSTCYTCQEGTYAPEGSGSCTKCVAGTYQYQTGQLSCSNCPED